MAKKGGGQQTVTQETRLDPKISGYWDQLYGDATRLGNQPFTPYGGERVAGLTPDEQAAGGMIRNAANNRYATGVIDRGVEFTNRAGTYDPGMVQAQQAGAPGGFGDPTGAAVAGRAGATTTSVPGVARDAGVLRGSVRNLGFRTGAQGMGAYSNPWEDQVVGSAMADLERARQGAISSGEVDAAAAGAFGGSRHGVADAQTNEAFLRQAGDLSGQLRSQGFQFAAGQGQTDAARAMQAGMANQNADLAAMGQAAGIGMANTAGINQASLTNAQLATQANLARGNLGLTRRAQDIGLSQFNAGQRAAADQFNVGTGMAQNQTRLAAGGQMGQLGGAYQGAELGYADALNRYGQGARGVDQARADADYQEFLRQQQHPYQGIALRQGILGAMPYQGTQMTTQPQQGGGWLQGAAGGAMAGGAAFGPWGALGGGLLGGLGVL